MFEPRLRSIVKASLGGALVVSLGFAGFGAGCSADRGSASTPTFDTTVGALVTQRCASCHSGATPAGSWRSTSYLEAVGCVADGRAATLPADESAPLVAVLASPTHAKLLAPDERDTLLRWVRASAPKFRGTVHAPSFVDPRSPLSHGHVLRDKRWKPMLDPEDEGSCGRCHDGSPSRPLDVTAGAPGAPACTTCHREPEGALGCNTCHGLGAGVEPSRRGAPYPPRDACFFPGEAQRGTAHAAHADATPTHAKGLACATCHPMPGQPVIGGAHGNGVVEVVLDKAIAGATATFDGTTKTCAGSACHARPGGGRPAPAWTEATAMKCGDCHGSPPPAHLQGPCTSCHAETNALGTAFSAATLHINGRVDLGDGSGKCGACHGRADDPWPSTGAHPMHAKPSAAAAAPCASCHAVPERFGPGTSHPRGGPAAVVLSGRATARGTTATYTAGSCREVYCHGAGLEGTIAATPAWNDSSGAARKCGACHATPPGPPHVGSPSCGLCHRDAVVTPTGPTIAPEWSSLHVNGDVDRGGY